MNDDVCFALQHVNVAYDGVPVLQDLNLQLTKQQSIVGLFGPNGSGKSTLLSMLCGDLNRYQGALQRLPRERIAYLPDKPVLYPWLTVQQVVQWYKRLYADFQEDVVDEFLQGSAIRLQASISSLSKGMSEQLHVALAMARYAAYRIFDEPLVGVDPATRERFLALIAAHQRQPAAPPMLISTHLIRDIGAICSDAIVLVRGTLVQTLHCEHDDGNYLENTYKTIVNNNE